MVVIERWTGAYACQLQAALRHTNESFAHHLGIAVRTVAAWHADPALTPRADVQAILDTTLSQAPQDAAARFAALLDREAANRPPGMPQALTVAVAVVRRDDTVLLVRRRGEDVHGLRWQFPAGIVKPDAEPGAVAVQETLSETGVHCAAHRDLGERVHPMTGVLCRYWLCRYLAGDAHNSDPVENTGVAWAPIATLGGFIPLADIYPPVLTALESADDAADD